VHTESFRIGENEVFLETGRIARQAHGAVVARCRDAFVLATVVANRGGAARGFLPLTVDYREKMSAMGRIPGNYFRRETRQSEHEILVSRLIDRTLRPLFPKSFQAESRVDVTVYSGDEDCDLVGLALIAAATAVHISDLPFAGPVGGLRLQSIGGKLCPFAPPSGDKESALDLIIAGGRDGVVMMEGHGQELSEAALCESVSAATQALDPALNAMDRLKTLCGKTKRPLVEDSRPTLTLPDSVLTAIDAALCTPGKSLRSAALDVARSAAEVALEDEEADAVARAFDAAVKKHARQQLADGQRMDGRGLDEVRPIECGVNLLARSHGSALFTRGETQALVSATIGGERESRDHELLMGNRRERFMLHYNFPSFSVGEARPNRGPGRREIGHGTLAQRAIIPVLPSPDSWPYTLRVVSDITESNGSSSMASVCGATLALASAGVPLSAPVAGIAMGLLLADGKYIVLTDILGDEDHLGDMDFKVAGTEHGITAVQLDNKLGALPESVLADALAKANTARRHILGEMSAALEDADKGAGDHAPRHVTFKINASRIGQVIGSGGRNLQEIQGKTNTKIEISRDGTVLILGRDREGVAAARKSIDRVALELKKNGLYQGHVTSTKDFGIFVRIADHDGLVHISELPQGRRPDEYEPSEKVMVRVLGADERGRIRLSVKAAAGATESDALNR